MRFSDDVAALNRLRLRFDLSFRMLTARLERYGIAISIHTLHRLLTNPAGAMRANDRTRHKIRVFREQLEAELLAPKGGRRERRTHRERRGSDAEAIRSE